MVEPVAIRVDVSEFSSLLRGVKEFDAALGRDLRKNIRVVAKAAAEDAKRTVMQPPLSGGHGRSTGLRANLARSIRVSIATPKKGEGDVVIRGGRTPLAKGYNAARGWRHPVFGDRNDWVNQRGRPYFGSVIAKHNDEMRAAVEAALRTAADAVGHGKR